MGLFDFFRTEKDDSVPKRPLKTEPVPPRHAEYGAPSGTKSAGAHPMQIRKPHSFEDVEEIIDRLKEKLTVIVYVNELNAATALRVTDILSGAIYALGGGMAELERDMYIFTPDGVNAR